jgi:hypothetical protein
MKKPHEGLGMTYMASVFLDFNHGEREGCTARCCMFKEEKEWTDRGRRLSRFAATISMFFKMMDDGSPVIRYAAIITECSSANRSGHLSWLLHCSKTRGEERLRGGGLEWNSADRGGN